MSRQVSTFSALFIIQAVVTPHIGASVWGELALDIIIAYGGIRLEGHLLETTFPITAEFGFGKFPINIG